MGFAQCTLYIVQMGVSWRTGLSVALALPEPKVSALRVPIPHAAGGTAALEYRGCAASGSARLNQRWPTASVRRSPRRPLLDAFRAAAIFPEPFAVSCDRSQAAVPCKGSLRQVLARSPFGGCGLRPALAWHSGLTPLVTRRRTQEKRRHCDKAVCVAKTETTGSGSWNPVSSFNPRPCGQKGNSMLPIPPQLTCDEGFDMFSTSLHALEDEIAQTDDPYTLGYLRGVRDFREQMAIITGMEKA